jgi:conserved oligomeric Golgi complex subunit 4
LQDFLQNNILMATIYRLPSTNGALDIKTVQSLSNPSDVARLLLDAVALERSIDAELDALLASSTTIDDTITALHGQTAAALSVAREEAAALCVSTADTAALADRVSGKVRELDAAQSRVRAALARIDVVRDRTRAMEGVKAALERDDLEAAAGCVARFLEIEDEEKLHRTQTSSFAVPASMQPAAELEQQATAMTEWRGRVEVAVRAKAKEAVAARSHADVARYARLFGPLRLQQEGVDLLTGYLRSLVAERAQADYDSLVDAFAGGAVLGARAADYTEVLTNLFRDVAAAIDEHIELFRDAFGPDAALTAVHALHAECDIRGNRILQRFLDHRGLARLAGQIGMRRRDDTAAEAAPVEPRSVEGYLSELLALCTRGEEYLQYLLARMAEAAAPSPLPPSRETSLRGGQLATSLRELLSYYISLEEYYIEESVAKAVRIDEPVPGSLTSSMVDDAFFVLLSAGRRALTTRRAPSAVAVLNQLHTALSTLLRSALARGLQGAAGRLTAVAPGAIRGSLGADGSSLDAATKAAVPFNNADVAASYVDKLRQQLEELVTPLFPAPHDRDRLKLVLVDLGKTAADFRRLSSQGAEQLCAAMMAHVRSALDAFVQSSYEIRGESDEAIGGVVSWSHALLAGFNVHFAWLQPLLTPTVFETVISSALDKIVARMEAAVAQKKFTQLGGLQLERDVRSLIVGLSELTSRSVRDKFARLQQTATVLGVESVEEASELASVGAGAWRLSSLDVRQALSQRVDLNASAIAAGDFR